MKTWHGTLGMFGPTEKNKNGLSLVDFCALNDLVITCTFFQHRPCCQHIWFHLAETKLAGHVLDYALVKQRFRSIVLDTRVLCKTYLQSDHRLVVAKSG